MAVPGSERARLDSWKEIAEYLGRDVRTVVRWEKEMGLPVHTVPGLRRRSVFAYTDELDDWLAGSPQIDGEGNGVPAEAARGDELTGEPLESRKDFLRQWPPIRALLIFGGAALAILLLLAYVFSMIRGNIAVSAAVEKITLQQNRVVARNKNGAEVWSYPLPQSGSDYQAGYQISFEENKGDIYLVGLAKKPDGFPEAYWLFSPAGRLIWTYAPQDVLKFGKETYAAPWTVRAMHRFSAGRQMRTVLALTHHTWWPTVVLLLDDQGRPLGKFVHSGWIKYLYSFAGQKGTLLVAGGASNAQNGAAIAILDPGQLTGSSPEEKGSQYECSSCEPGGPVKYFVFPRSELNLVTGSTYNYPSPGFRGGRIMVDTAEEEVEQPSMPHAAAIYEFSPDLELLRASYGDRYWDLHRKLEVQGRIMHSKAECPDRNGPRSVRSWDPQNGWKEIHPN